MFGWQSTSNQQNLKKELIMHLKNQGQVEAFLDHDTGHKSPSPQTSEKHCESRRQDAAVGEACHPQGTVGDQGWNDASPGKNLKYRSRSKRYSNPIIPSGRRKKLAWTVQEEEALKDAVQKFSVNSDGTLPWTKILEFGCRVFHKTHQPGDLKDKWRNIQISVRCIRLNRLICGISSWTDGQPIRFERFFRKTPSNRSVRYGSDPYHPKLSGMDRYSLVRHIPVNAAVNPYYRYVISAIEAVGQGVDPSGPKDIYGQLFDSNKEDLQRWITSYKNK
uniref:Uncharacterized protein LOC105051333 n=1 Tax=Elaeis guineensis var. tenera TaxID=51953 RepID=A0A6J0PMK6_ELAGV|nr:uncharacterized protein LOC105051333 [Elaeis guineensis]